MAFRGERFNIDLHSLFEEEDSEQGDSEKSSKILDASSSVIPVKDIQERPPAAKPPSAPSIKIKSSGFPTHKKRTGPSRFDSETASPEQKLGTAVRYIEQQNAQNESNPPDASRDELSERESIDRENKQKLASMSAAEIAKERQELLAGLPPSLVHRLLSRSAPGSAAENCSDSTFTLAQPQEPHQTQPTTVGIISDEKVEKTVRFAEDSSIGKKSKSSSAGQFSSLADDAMTDGDQHSFHFPKPQKPSEPDPTSPSFFHDLHQKYFASLPVDPSKLAWMQDAGNDSTYSPNLTQIEIPNLRFNFNGSLITPRQAERVPVTEGLHHHGEAASSAGYTVPELARLSRSTIATQRCIAYQTLGRIMYRLGTGEFGDIDEKIPKGLWKCINDGHVIKTLEEEANKKNGHISANAYAIEALWLWRKGGGQKIRAD